MKIAFDSSKNGRFRLVNPFCQVNFPSTVTASYLDFRFSQAGTFKDLSDGVHGRSSSPSSFVHGLGSWLTHQMTVSHFFLNFFTNSIIRFISWDSSVFSILTNHPSKPKNFWMEANWSVAASIFSKSLEHRIFPSFHSVMIVPRHIEQFEWAVSVQEVARRNIQKLLIGWNAKASFWLAFMKNWEKTHLVW